MKANDSDDSWVVVRGGRKKHAGRALRIFQEQGKIVHSNDNLGETPNLPGWSVEALKEGKTRRRGKEETREEKIQRLECLVKECRYGHARGYSHKTKIFKLLTPLSC
jgi:hypothetical protein